MAIQWMATPSDQVMEDTKAYVNISLNQIIYFTASVATQKSSTQQLVTTPTIQPIQELAATPTVNKYTVVKLHQFGHGGWNV